MDTLTEKVKYFLNKHNLLANDVPILVGFSGGYDSMCLLDILTNLQLSVIAVHLNHNWRKEESDKEELNCRKYCETKQIEFYSEKLAPEIPKTETAAREARYEFFESCARKFKAKAVLTAHNANDNAETLIYRIAKGTGIRGLCGIAENRGIYYRPLLKISREEIVEYNNAHALKPNFDSSNKNTKYKRNLIRENIIPELMKINATVIDAINSLSEIAILESNIADEYLELLKEPFITKNFLSYSKNVQTKLIYKLFTDNQIEYDKSKILRAINFILENSTSKSGKRYSLGEDLWLFTNTESIELIKKTITSNEEIQINKEGDYKIFGKLFHLEVYNEKVKAFPKDSERIAYVDLSGIKELTIRHRRNGDIIMPLGCQGTQKLKKYLNGKKIPKHKRDELIFIAHDKEILWAPELGISEKIKVKETPTHKIWLSEE